MKIKNLIDEDFINYKKPSMFLGFNSCTFKCDKECGEQVCQNSDLASAPSIEISYEEILERYYNNPITEALVFGGLEPFDSFEDLYNLISLLREKNEDDIVIYTGYYPDEITNQLNKLYKFKNIIIKFGRFIPNKSSRYDELLGVTLASDNQIAIKLEGK